jgi:hypothetical protein
MVRNIIYGVLPATALLFAGEPFGQYPRRTIECDVTLNVESHNIKTQEATQPNTYKEKIRIEFIGEDTALVTSIVKSVTGAVLKEKITTTDKRYQFGQIDPPRDPKELSNAMYIDKTTAQILSYSAAVRGDYYTLFTGTGPCGNLKVVAKF